MLGLIGRVIKSPWFWSLVGVIILCVMIWFLFGAIGFGGVYPFEDPLYRLAAILVVVVFFFIFVFVSLIRSQRRNQKMVSELDAAGDAAVSEEDQEMTAQEVATLRERMHEAMRQLRRAKFGRGFGRRYLYQLPWYMLIGPPGSGKTTALVKSGLRFVLSDKLGTEAVRGVGGTRNCDWWFTDEAVLIDTAGRYTTQDVRASVDTTAWQSFLQLLRRNRPRQPLNGVFIVIAINEVMQMDEAARTAHARIIRTRINELHEVLRQRFPIYVLLTKCDLVAGFTEFFDELGSEERQQVWGMTFAVDGDRAADGTAAGFTREFDQLVDRLNDRLIDRMHREMDIERRALVYGFPAQMASLRDLLQEFLDAVFRPSQFEERPMLRGVYFTSGTQEGTPIDRLMGALASRFGVSRSSLPAFSGGGRSYFLTRLLRDVAFPEAYIAVARSPRERRRIWVRRTGYAVITLLVVAALAAWGISYTGNTDLIESVETDMDRYTDALVAVNVVSVDDTDFAKVSGVLDILREIPTGYEANVDDPPLNLTFGLYQGERLNVPAVATYRRALDKLLAPRLFLHLEQKIRDNLDNQDALYDYLRVYLMLGNAGQMDDALIKRVLAQDWEALYPGDDNATLRTNLETHLATLLEQPGYDFALDTGLVQRARQALTSIPLASEAYEAIKGSAQARNLDTWRVVDHIDTQGHLVLMRRSPDTPLTAGIPGLYTYNGFHDVFLPALDSIANRVASQSWVLSGSDSEAAQSAALEAFKQSVIQAYLNDYVEQWDRLLNDVTVRPVDSVDDARAVLNILSSPNSPLKTFLNDVSEQTTLARPAPAPADGAAGANGGNGSPPADGAAPEDGSGDAAADDAGGGILGTDGAAAPAAPLPGQYVNDQFEALHGMVQGEGGQPPQLDGLITDLRALYEGLNAFQAGDGSIPPDLAAALQKLNETAGSLPEPIGSIAAEVMAQTAALSTSGARNQINEVYLTTLQGLCEQSLANRYPFEATSTNEVTLNAFATMFGPSGLLDNFFQQNLAAHADTSKKPWTWKEAAEPLNLSVVALQQFERAAEVRRVFFAQGASPKVQFYLTPDVMSETINRAVITVDGQELAYSFGPNTPVLMTWPGPPDNPPGASIEFTPLVDDQPNRLSFQGPWGWFRMIDDRLDQAEVQPGETSDTLKATISAGDRSATYDVRADGVTNPFNMPELREFRCPTTL